VIRLAYAPRSYQRRIHDALTRFIILLCHRRAGKTVAAVNHLIREAVRCQRPDPQVAYIAPNARQARRISWRYLLGFTAPIPGRKVNVTEMTVTLPGNRRLMVLGAENVHALRGMYLDHACLDEFAQMRPEAWEEVIFPALLDRDGSALIAGTPMGENLFKELWDRVISDPEWTRILLTIDDTKALSEKAVDLARRTMSPGRFRQEMLCSFEAVIEGAYYGQLMAQARDQGRITRVPYDPALGVTVAVDLGMADAFAMWFLQEPRGGAVRAIRYHEWSYYDGYAQIKREVDAFGYNVTRWIAPHDIAVTEQGTGKTRHEQAAAVGMPFEKSRRMSLEDGIEAVRVLLPRMEFDEEHCKKGLTALRQYRADWDPVKKIGSKKPVHDFTSHPADALRTYATAMHGSTSDWTVSAAEVEEAMRAARAGRGNGRNYSRGMQT